MIGGRWKHSFVGKRVDFVGRSGKVVEWLGVMSGPTGRRSWTEAVNARIVAESFEPGSRVVVVVRRHGVVAPQQVTALGRDALQGRLVLPVEEAGSFAALVVEDPLTSMQTPSAFRSMIEIEIDGVVVRLSESKRMKTQRKAGPVRLREQP